MSSKTKFEYYVNVPTDNMIFVNMWLDLHAQWYKLTEILDYWTGDIRQLVVVFNNQADANRFKEMLRATGI